MKQIAKEILVYGNCGIVRFCGKAAYGRVSVNGGAACVDDVSLSDFVLWFRLRRDRLMRRLYLGNYRPSPVRRTHIARKNEKKRRYLNMRKLGAKHKEAAGFARTSKGYWRVAKHLGYKAGMLAVPPKGNERSESGVV